MAFNSSILTENNNASLFDLESITEKYNENYIIDLLEFNNDAHTLDLAYKFDQYKALVEGHNNGTDIAITEAINVKKIYERLSELIDKIIDFIRNFINTVYNRSKKATLEFERCRRDSGGFNFKFDAAEFERWFSAHWNRLVDEGNKPNMSKSEYRTQMMNNIINRINNIDSEEFDFIYYTYHTPDKIDGNDPKSSIGQLLLALERILKDQEDYTSSDADLEVAFKGLKRKIRDNRREFDGVVSSPETFKKCIMTNVIYNEKKRTTFKEWRTHISDDIISSFGQNFVYSRCEGMKEELEKAKKLLNEYKDTVTPETAAQANVIIGQIKRIVDSWCWYINRTTTAHDNELRYIVKRYNSISNSVYHRSMNEAGYIHGEEFNSDTLFANEDMRDFSNQEWMDLRLTTECYNLSYVIKESVANIMLQEAIIMTDDQPYKYDRLVAMREAEENKRSQAIQNIIQAIREIFNTFVNNIRAITGANKKFIEDNKALIEKPIKPDATITSRGDIIAGFYRVQQPLVIEPFNYETMKDDLVDKKTFFKNRILPQLNKSSNFSKRDVKYTDEMKITEFCKLYYGASANTEKYKACVYKGSEFETNKNNFIKELQAGTVVNSTKKDLDTVENNIKTSGVDLKGHTPQDQSQNANNVPKPTDAQAAANTVKQAQGTKQEGYYSILFNTEIFSEVQMEGIRDKSTNGDNVANATNDMAGAAKVYLEAYKDVILSKATAVDFVFAEIMAVIRAHVGKPANPPKQKENKAAPNAPKHTDAQAAADTAAQNPA